VSDILFKVQQGKHMFCCWENSCCNYRIPEVPTTRFPVQPVLKALEGSGKSQGTMSSEGGFHPSGCAGCGKRDGGLELTVRIFY
jgi:hypothetical protein